MRWKFTFNAATDNKIISEPIGWNDIEFIIERNKEWHGIFIEHSLPLQFYNDPNDSDKDAFNYLKDIFDEFGVDGYVLMKVELACSDTDDYIEEGQWRINFTSYTEVMDNGLCTIELNLEPDDCLMTFKNRYDQRVDLDSLESFDGEVLVDYSALGTSIVIEPKSLPIITDVTFDNEVVEDSTLYLYGGTDTITAGTGTSYQEFLRYIQFPFNLIDLNEVETYLNPGNASFLTSPEVEALFDILLPGSYTVNIPYFSVNISVFG